MVQLQGAEAQHVTVRNEMTDFWQGIRWALSWMQKPFTDTEYSIPDAVKLFAASLLFCARHLHGVNGEGGWCAPPRRLCSALGPCSERCVGQRCTGSRGSSACRRGGGTGRDMGWCLVAWLALLGMPGQTGKPVMVYDAVCGRDTWKCAMNIQSKGLKLILIMPEN